MRADRLLAILLILQRGGRVTAGDLARRLEVSERTIYRDLEALGASGVPVYCEPGRNGGVRLLEGYETDLTGLSLAEAELVPLLGLADVFAGLGVAASLEGAEAKVLAALPERQRKRAEQSRRKIFVDLSRWWDHAEPVQFLPVVVEAVFAGRRLRVDYRRGEDGSVAKRTLDPFGVVVQGGTWYMVAQAQQRSVRIYRVSRLLDCEPTDEHFAIPDDFDLARFWAQRKEDFHMTRSMYTTRVRVRTGALRRLVHRRDHAVVSPPDADGWTVVDVPFETRWTALQSLLGMGAAVELLEPVDLRTALADALSGARALYGTSGAAGERR